MYVMNNKALIKKSNQVLVKKCKVIFGQLLNFLKILTSFFYSSRFQAALSGIRHYQSEQLEQGRQKQINFQVQQQLPTKEIIDRYLSLFRSKTQRKKSQSESLVMELMSQQLGRSDVFKEYSKEQQSQQKIQNAKYIEKEPERQDKLNEVIKLICETQALGEESRSTILAKIREIIPIAGIGSKQLKGNQNDIHKQPSDNIPQKVAATRLKDHKPQIKVNQTLQQSQSQLYNLKTLDSILNQRQQQLELTRRQQLLRLESNNSLSFEQKMSQRERIIKWYHLKISQSASTRAQIWQGFNFAKIILANNQILGNCHRKDQERTDGWKQLNSQLKQQQIQTDEKISHSIYENRPQKISVEYNAAQISLENEEDRISMLKQQQYSDQLQLHKQKSSDSPESADSVLKKFIFLDSVEKISYDYEEDSPDSKQSNHLKRKQKLQCEMSEEPSNVSHSDDYPVHLSALSSPPPILTPYSILSQEEKQDIFQYIFIDICLQLSDELPQQSKAYTAIQTLLKSQRQREKRTMGYNFNPIVIKDYLTSLLTHIKSQRTLFQHFCQNIERPLGPTTRQLLKYLQVNQSQQEDNQFIQTPNIIEEWVFGEFDRQNIEELRLSPYFDDQNKEKKRVILVKNAVHIFHKAVFDAYNQILDKKRPFGQWGEPLAWKKTPKFKQKRSLQQRQALLQLASDQLLQYTKLTYGLIFDKQHCNLNKSTIPQGYLQKWQNQRLYKILQQFLDDVQERLRFIDDQQAQELIRVSQSIEDTLLNQFIDQFKQ